MNFLGHFLLAGDDEGLLIGNFIADFVKGKSYMEFPEDISRGIIMHREIDFFTDNHVDFKRSKKRISDRHHHFSGVIIDIFYDHFLARNFKEVSGKELKEFAEKSYAVIERYHHELPISSKHLFGYMKRDNWLLRYEGFGGIEKTLSGMSKRIRHANLLDKAILDLEIHYEAMEQDFNNFIKDAISSFKNWSIGNSGEAKK